MSNSSRKNRSRPMSNQRGGYPAPAATLDEMPKVPTGPAEPKVTPRSGRPIGLAPLIADALDELGKDRPVFGSLAVAMALDDAGCAGIPHSSVYNPVTEYVRKRVPNLDMVYTTATEVIAERGDIRARVTMPEYVADFLLTYDTCDAYPALVMQFGQAATVPTGEEAAAA